MKTPLYKWNGQYVGFVYNDRLFDAASGYIGWLDDDGRCWNADGSFLGELVEQNYVLRRSSMATPASKAVKARPATPATPARKANRPGRATRAGWVDVLAEL